MIIEHGNYQIRPFINKCCWEIYRRVTDKKTGELTDKWTSFGKYPWDIPQALSIVYELEMREGEDVKGLEEAIKEAERLQKELKELVVDEEKLGAGKKMIR